MAKKDIGKEVVDGAIDKATEVASTGVDAAKGALGAVGGAIGGLGKKAKAAAAKAVDVAGDAAQSAKNAVEGAVDAAQDVAGGAIDKAKELAAGAGDIVEGVADKVGDVVGDVTKGAKDLVGDVADKVGDVATGAVGAVGTLADGAVDLTKAAASQVGEVAGDAVDAAKGVGGAAIAGGAAVIGGAAALAGGLGKGVKDVAGDALGVAGGVAGGAIGAVTGAVDEVSGKKSGILLPLLAMTAIGGLLAYGLVTWAGKGAKVEAPVVGAISAPSWFAGLGDKFKAQFPWLKLDFKGGSVVASGEAADAAARDAALKAVETEIGAGEGKGASVIDAITVLGSKEKPVGAALAALGANPDVAACGTAFTDTMAGRTINFATGKAVISADSGALLSALTGIATACKAHKIEIAGHTDAKGNPEANKALSQARADAVKAFWTSKGVAAEGLTATGYGADKPIDATGTAEADAKNRRVEFVVS